MLYIHISWISGQCTTESCTAARSSWHDGCTQTLELPIHHSILALSHSVPLWTVHFQSYLVFCFWITRIVNTRLCSQYCGASLAEPSTASLPLALYGLPLFSHCSILVGWFATLGPLAAATCPIQATPHIPFWHFLTLGPTCSHYSHLALFDAI